MLDIEKLMREGKSLDEIGKMVTDEMNAAQIKIDAEKEAARIAAEKKARAKAEAEKASQRKADARKAAVAAAMSYYALVYPEFSTENLEEFAKTAIDSVAKSIEMVKKLEEGKFTSIFEIFG